MSARPTVLWDLDGTLIGLRKRTFTTLMPGAAAWVFRDLVPPHRFLPVLRRTLRDVRANDTEHTNTELMLRLLGERTGIGHTVAASRLTRLAEVEFVRLRACFPARPAAAATVRDLTAAGARQVVATNPLWPLSTVEARIRWGGHDRAAFSYVTCGENMHRSKPRLDFYRELLDRLGVSTRECVMIGNDPGNDGPATELGIPVFLLGARPADVPPAMVRTGLVTTGDHRALRRWLDIEEDSCSSS
ncbi:HAD family hydrolase [Nocardia sp. CNY236]|uniref:HAD family hydrolase n=1 Tax=Nocardia sp. CNY236 TaxID=1169152 RepID=UPI000418EC0F|nr:HAD family hydrolase [Nocardia sp. CNY236]